MNASWIASVRLNIKRTLFTTQNKNILVKILVTSVAQPPGYLVVVVPDQRLSDDR